MDPTKSCTFCLSTILITESMLLFTKRDPLPKIQVITWLFSCIFGNTGPPSSEKKKTRQPTLQCDVARKARTPQQLIDLRVGSRPTNIDRLSPAGLTRTRLKSLARRRRRYHRQDGGGARQSPAVRLSLSLSLIACLVFGYSVNAGWETTALDFL